MLKLFELEEGRLLSRDVETLPAGEEYDLIVCGLGTAGAPAAIFSAENGLRVLGVESMSFVGGTHSGGGILGHYFGCDGGRYEKLDDAVRDFAEQYTVNAAESRKYLWEQALVRLGVTCSYESCVIGVYLDGERFCGVRLLTPEGIVDVRSKILFDCTADARVARLAGCPTVAGRSLDGQMQPYSLVSLVYDGKKYRYTNVDFGRVDPGDPRSLSEAVLFSRSYAIQEGHEGTEHIAQTPMLGLREGERIVAEEGVSLKDFFQGKHTDTPAYYAYADLDKHGWDVAFDGEVLGDWAIGANLIAYNLTIPVPYRVILPRNREGILVPCRALGVDRDVSSCVRMNPDMKKLAELAAQWATIAIRENLPLRQVPYALLSEKLAQSGCLKESDNRGFRIDGKKNWDGTPLKAEDVTWITEPQDLSKRLASEKPGLAIWSAMQMEERAIPTLKSLLRSEEENIRRHAAMALAGLKSREALPLLRQMAKERDPLMLKDCRKHNNLRGCMAIYWLGRLADREMTEELLSLITSPEEAERPLYHQGEDRTTRYRIRDFQGIYYQFVSQAVMALIRIGDAHPDLRETIAQGFRQAFADESYVSRFTARPPQSSEGNAVLTLKTVTDTTARRWESA